MGTRARAWFATVTAGFGLLLLPPAAHAATGTVHLEGPSSSGTQLAFDLETAGRVVSTASSADLRTGTSSTTAHRQLGAMNAAGVAKLGLVDFDSITCADLRTATFTTAVLTGASSTSDPVAGTVFAARSRIDTYAKLVIESVDLTSPTGLVLRFETCPLDSTPPAVTPAVEGPEGAAGWFVGDVTVTWTVVDPETEPAVIGCEELSVVADTTGVTSTCAATSAGGTTNASVTVMRDVTAPVVAYSGNQESYRLDEDVHIDCAASDATSGVASDTCEPVHAPAYELGPGTHSVSASAVDVAGNDGSGEASFEVVVDAEGVVGLIGRLVGDPELSAALSQRVREIESAPNPQAKNGKVASFQKYVRARSGKSLDPAVASLLADLAGQL